MQRAGESAIRVYEALQLVVEVEVEVAMVAVAAAAVVAVAAAAAAVAVVAPPRSGGRPCASKGPPRRSPAAAAGAPHSQKPSARTDEQGSESEPPQRDLTMNWAPRARGRIKEPGRAVRLFPSGGARSRPPRMSPVHVPARPRAAPRAARRGLRGRAGRAPGHSQAATPECPRHTRGRRGEWEGSVGAQTCSSSARESGWKKNAFKRLHAAQVLR